MILHVQNEGWGTTHEAKLTAELILGNRSIATIRSQVGQFRAGILIDISAMLEADQLTQIGGREREIKIQGIFGYEENAPDEKRHHRALSFGPTPFHTPPRVGGGPSPVSGTYEALLAPEGENYKIAIPTAHSLKAKETDRLKLVIGAGASSIHQFRVFVEFSDGTLVEKGPFLLRFFIPRSNVIRIIENEGLSTTIGGVDRRYFLDN